jgi:hypothetical protein
MYNIKIQVKILRKFKEKKGLRYIMRKKEKVIYAIAVIIILMIFIKMQTKDNPRIESQLYSQSQPKDEMTTILQDNKAEVESSYNRENNKENTIQDIEINETITEFDSKQIDLDNDGVDENIKLNQKGNTLILNVNDNNIIVNKEFNYDSRFMDMPKFIRYLETKR